MNKTTKNYRSNQSLNYQDSELTSRIVYYLYYIYTRDKFIANVSYTC